MALQCPLPLSRPRPLATSSPRLHQHSLFGDEMLFILQVAAGIAASLGAVVANPVPVPIASPLPRSCTPSFQDYYSVAIRHSPSGNFWSVESAGLGAGSTVTTKPEANTTFQFSTAPGPNKAQQIIRCAPCCRGCPGFRCIRIAERWHLYLEFLLTPQTRERWHIRSHCRARRR